MTQNQIVVCNVKINVDAQGRYSLNDLHRAAGGDRSGRPGTFIKTPKVQEMLAVLREEGVDPVGVEGVGRYATTSVVKELVYAYGMWISTAFQLHVIRTFDRVVQEELAFERKERALLSNQFATLTKAKGGDSIQAARVFTQQTNAVTNAENKEFEARHINTQLTNTLGYIKRALKQNKDIAPILKWQEEQDRLPAQDRTLHYQ